MNLAMNAPSLKRSMADVFRKLPLQTPNNCWNIRHPSAAENHSTRVRTIRYSQVKSTFAIPSYIHTHTHTAALSWPLPVGSAQ